MSDTDGKINWFEVPAENADRARSFYGGLFDWTFRPFDDAGDYQLTDGGAVFTSDKKGVLVYFGTSDLDTSVVRVGELGGSAGEVQVIPAAGRYATCTDTEGNTFGLFEPGGSS